MSRVLVCLPEVPNGRVAGGYGRNAAIVRSLRRLGCEIVVVAMSSQRDGGTTEKLAADGIPVLALDRDRISLPAVLASGFDVVIITYFELAEQLLPIVYGHAHDARVVIDSVDVHYLRALRQAEIEGDEAGIARAERIRQRECEVYRRADVVLAVSEDEQEHLSELVPGVPVGLVPNVHAVDADPPGPRGRRGALFVGAYNFPPNRDAAQFVCAEIMPRLRALGYEEPVELVGPYLDDELAATARASGAEPVGFVHELKPLYRTHRVSIAPLRFGSGLKNKVGEALGAGLPVVGTAIGVEGFPPCQGIIQADDPDAFATAVLELVVDDDDWSRRSAEGRELIRSCYGPERCDRELGDVLDYLS